MTVIELIEKLMRANPNATVYIDARQMKTIVELDDELTIDRYSSYPVKIDISEIIAKAKGEDK